MSAQTIAETPDQDAILAQALLWLPPETWTVKVNPREEWMQMYDEAMRTMRDNFYDPNLHGVDWPAVTERYRPLVKRLTSKNELRDVLEQALGELSVLHVFVDVEGGEAFEKIGMGQSSACLGAKFEQVPQGLRITKIYDTSEVLMAPNSPLSAMAVDLRPGDIITRIDGALVNALSDPLPKLLMGKAYSQVLLEVIRGPRTKEEMAELEELQEMIESVQQSSSSLGVAQSRSEGRPFRLLPWHQKVAHKYRRGSQWRWSTKQPEKIRRAIFQRRDFECVQSVDGYRTIGFEIESIGVALVVGETLQRRGQ